MGRERIRVLHVDDHADYVNMPAAELERIDERLVVDVVDTVADAIGALEAGEVDCLVTEYHLETGADQPVDRLRTVDPSVPIVLFTEADLSVVEGVLEDGPTEYVAKDGASLAATYRLLTERIGRLVDTQPTAGTEPSLSAATSRLAGELAVPACVLVAGDPAFVNDAFADRFDVGADDLEFETLTDLAGRENGELASFLRAPDASRFTFEGKDGRTISVHAAVDESAATVATLWTDGVDGPTPIERTMLDSLLEEIPFAIYFKDTQSRHVRASDALPRMNVDGYIESPEGKVHYTAADVLGKTDFDLYPLDHALPAGRGRRGGHGHRGATRPVQPATR